MVIDSTRQKSMVFGADDGTSDLDAYVYTSFPPTTQTQYDTGINVPIATALTTSQLTATTDSNDYVHLFAVDSSASYNIYYTYSETWGQNWSAKTNVMNNSGAVKISI